MNLFYLKGLVTTNSGSIETKRNIFSGNLSYGLRSSDNDAVRILTREI